MNLILRLEAHFQTIKDTFPISLEIFLVQFCFLEAESHDIALAGMEFIDQTCPRTSLQVLQPRLMTAGIKGTSTTMPSFVLVSVKLFLHVISWVEGVAF